MVCFIQMQMEGNCTKIKKIENYQWQSVFFSLFELWPILNPENRRNFYCSNHKNSHRNMRYMCEQGICCVLYSNVKMIVNTTN